MLTSIGFVDITFILNFYCRIVYFVPNINIQKSNQFSKETLKTGTTFKIIILIFFHFFFIQFFIIGSQVDTINKNK